MSLIGSTIKFILELSLLFAILISFVTHFLLWYEIRLAMLEGVYKNPLPYLSLVKNFLIETACYFVAALLTPFGYFSSSGPAISETNKNPPILLVHGYLHNQSDWLWFKQQLKKIPDLGPIYTLNVVPVFASIEDLALVVKQKVEEILVTTGHKDIQLVGHSMGGIISSFYAEYLDTQKVVSKVITLGSPFQGTRLAALGFGKNVEEIFPKSSFLQTLNEKIQYSHAKYYSVASKLDNIIVPWQAALPIHITPKQSESTLILQDHGHLRLLISPEVVLQVAHWLQQ